MAPFRLASVKFPSAVVAAAQSLVTQLKNVGRVEVGFQSEDEPLLWSDEERCPQIELSRCQRGAEEPKGERQLRGGDLGAGGALSLADGSVTAHALPTHLRRR